VCCDMARTRYPYSRRPTSARVQPEEEKPSKKAQTARGSEPSYPWRGEELDVYGRGASRRRAAVAVPCMIVQRKATLMSAVKSRAIIAHLQYEIAQRSPLTMITDWDAHVSCTITPYPTLQGDAT